MFALQLYVSAWRHGLRVAASFAAIFLALAGFAGLVAAIPLYLATIAAPAWSGLLLPALLVLLLALILPLALGFATQPESARPAADLGPDREREALEAVLDRV